MKSILETLYKIRFDTKEEANKAIKLFIDLTNQGPLPLNDFLRAIQPELISGNWKRYSWENVDSGDVYSYSYGEDPDHWRINLPVPKFI